MNRTKLIQDSTSAYIIAYNQAMQETHNPNMAAQIAGMISMNAFKAEIEQEQQAQSLLGIMLSMVEQVRQDGDDSEKE